MKVTRVVCALALSLTGGVGVAPAGRLVRRKCLASGGGDQAAGTRPQAETARQRPLGRCRPSQRGQDTPPATRQP